MIAERHSSRARTLACAGLLVVAACQRPIVGERNGAAVQPEGARIVLLAGEVDVHGHAVVTYRLTEDGLAVSAARAAVLSPRFTLATLETNPVDGLAAWKSQLLTGSQTAVKLKPAGPETPAAQVRSGVKQPGADSGGALVDEGDGTWRYVFGAALGAVAPDTTLRAGAWLNGVAGTALTSAALDFRPDGGEALHRDVVSDVSCGRCHGTLLAHGRRSGVRLCLTCHTWQCTDPDTVDPAAMVTTSVTAATDPNPLELGRMVHRIHRGKELPTLYQASSAAVPAPALGGTNDLPLPFSPENSTTPLLGRKYSIVGHYSSEAVFGAVVQRATNGTPARTLAAGVVFPRELRECATCHGEASQGWESSYTISRRVCAGCHPDAYFGTAPMPASDQAHLAHPGGPQADDSACAGCHVGPAGSGPKLYAPINGDAPVHGALEASKRYDLPTLRIVRVDGMIPGGHPSVRFQLRDRAGPLGPALAAPTPAYEPDSATSSFVPRAFSSFSLKIAGPTAPDYGIDQRGWDPISSGVAAGNPDPLDPASIVSTGTADEFVYTFASTIPLNATGTWSVGMEGRRRVKMPHYDKASDTFNWPYSGESVTETPDNPVVHVDLATGTWVSAGPDASAPRREVISQEKCLSCHGRFQLHGGLRHTVAYCLLCHTPRATDWARRPGVSTAGTVTLAATLDGVEERSIHMKVMVHRIHTGGRRDAATLEAIEPHVIYGRGGPLYFDEGLFPGDLRDCTVCHAGKTYLVEKVPAAAAPTVANETATIRHKAKVAAHVAGETSTPPVQAACLGCHASGASLEHAASKTAGTVETCAQCHEKGPLSVEVAHGLAPPASASSAFSSLVQEIIVPRCATAACHAGSPPTAWPQLDADVAYANLVNVASQQTGMKLVAPGDPEQSYLLQKLRGGPGVVGQLMPTDGLLDAADITLIETWIANGAPND